ncbi:hypothetical protein N431DRAFT_558540 [Stipitochalara longipes BDJ]|nr:hypothetical protein N431DRAFT_558540 [Stipitochalara longipes BDJ]
MPVLEILQLKVKPNITPTDPSILTSLQTVRSLLAQKIHPTHSRFYQSIEDASLIYVLGLWDSLSQHQDFLSSPFRAEVLAPQEHLLDFSWCVHIPLEKMEDLPLEAPVVAIARLKVKSGEHVVIHKEITGRYREVLEESTKPFGVVEGWRVDGGEEGEREQLVITGWREREDHLAFTASSREKFEDYRGLREHWESVEASHMKDMER